MTWSPASNRPPPTRSPGLAQTRKQTFTLGGSDRISTTKGYTDTVQTTETLNHYDSDSDSPAWTQTKQARRSNGMGHH